MLLAASNVAADDLLRASEDRLREAERELEQERNHQKRKDIEYLEQKASRDEREKEREKELIEREARVREEMGDLSALHQKMSVELSGSIKVRHPRGRNLLSQHESCLDNEYNDTISCPEVAQQSLLHSDLFPSAFFYVVKFIRKYSFSFDHFALSFSFLLLHLFLFYSYSLYSPSSLYSLYSLPLSLLILFRPFLPFLPPSSPLRASL